MGPVLDDVSSLENRVKSIYLSTRKAKATFQAGSRSSPDQYCSEFPKGSPSAGSSGGQHFSRLPEITSDSDSRLSSGCHESSSDDEDLEISPPKQSSYRPEPEDPSTIAHLSRFRLSPSSSEKYLVRNAPVYPDEIVVGPMRLTNTLGRASFHVRSHAVKSNRARARARSLLISEQAHMPPSWLQEDRTSCLELLQDMNREY